MKKIISLKEMLIVLISVVLVTVCGSAFAADLVLGNNNNTPSEITGNEYENAQNVAEDKNAVPNTTANNTAEINSFNNNVRTYNNNNTKDLPQTGIEDYNIGILIVICVASAIFAYKKINDYKNV